MLHLRPYSCNIHHLTQQLSSLARFILIFQWLIQVPFLGNCFSQQTTQATVWNGLDSSCLHYTSMLVIRLSSSEISKTTNLPTNKDPRLISSLNCCSHAIIVYACCDSRFRRCQRSPICQKWSASVLTAVLLVCTCQLHISLGSLSLRFV